MSRFKFRAWHKKNKELVYFDNQKLKKDQFQAQYLVSLLNGDYGNVLMQCTGFLDVNGTYIYEGDIIEDTFINEKYLVYWNKASAMFLISTINGDGGNSLHVADMVQIKVVGNLYEENFGFSKDLKTY